MQASCLSTPCIRMFRSMNSLLRQSLKPQHCIRASGVRSCVLNNQLSVSSLLHRKDDRVQSDNLERRNMPETYATFLHQPQPKDKGAFGEPNQVPEDE